VALVVDATRSATATVVVSTTTSLAAKMPVISRDPAARLYSSTGTPVATDPWRSNGYPAWYAWDITAVGGAKSSLLLGFYNSSSEYNMAVAGQAFNLPGSFVIEGHAQAGGAVPASGWSPLATVTGNALRDRTFILNAAGNNWIRFRATAGYPGNQPSNGDCAGYFDLHDISASGNSDSWAFLGDSIVSIYLSHDDESGGTPATNNTFGDLIAAGAGQVPAFENAGTGYDTVNDGASRLTTVLQSSKARFIPIAYGMNDASNGAPSDLSFSVALRALAQRVLDDGRIPVIPTVPATNDASHNAGLGDPITGCSTCINHQIYLLRNAMRAEGKQVLDGPDLWTYFLNNLSQMGAGGDVHPRGAGAAAYRVQWATAMLQEVYGVP
jgi:hypothetical protein